MLLAILETLHESLAPEEMPAEPGSVPIPPGHVRLFHQTDLKNFDSIRQHGIQFKHARGIEGPRAIYADEKGFYGKPGDVPTVEFHVPADRWRKPFVQGDVDPSSIIGLHQSWHDTVRYIEDSPDLLKQVLSGELDHVIGDTDPKYGKAIEYLKRKNGSITS